MNIVLEAFEALQDPAAPKNAALMELTALSFFAFTALYGIAHVFSQALIPHYRRLSYGQQVDWCTRFTSVSHAILTVQAAYQIVVLDKDGLGSQPFHGYSVYAKVFSCVSIGYFISDMLVLIRHFNHFGNFMMNAQYIIHHFFGAIGYMIVVDQATFFWFGMFRLLSEASTPFVAAHCLMSTSQNLKGGRLFVLNGGLLLLAFFVVRVVALPYYWHVALKFWHQLTSPLWLKISFFIFSLIGDSLNVYWFVTITRDAYYTVRNTAVPEEERIRLKTE